MRAVYSYRGYICGDFDGNNSVDTVYQRLVSELTHTQVDSLPGLVSNNPDTVSNYFWRNKLNTVLTTAGAKADTLHTAGRLGLYVMLNVGDVNSDQKDEIAVVAILDDFSQLNSCVVYSLCGQQWSEVGRFKINENSFIYNQEDREDSIALHSRIKGSLEKRDGVWMYKDYEEWFAAETKEEAEKMHVLRVEPCIQ